MKRSLQLLFILFLTSCSVSKIIDNRLEKINLYNDDIDYEIHLTKDSKKVKLIPLRHLGTPKFYENLTDLIKEYQNKDYTVYYEKLITDETVNDDDLRKFRKISGLKEDIKNEENLSYEDLLFEKIKTIYPDFEFKKEVIHQPKYDILIFDKSKSKNVDVTIRQFVKEYERLNSEIKLDSCDYLDNWKNTECSTTMKKGLDKIVVDYRNQHVINEIIESTNKKIIILYGEQHMKGISKGLIKNGFVKAN